MQKGKRRGDERRKAGEKRQGENGRGSMRSVFQKSALSGVASYGALGHVPPRLVIVSFLVHFGVTLRGEPTIQVLCSLQD